MFKRKVSHVFRDVLGLYEIHHIAIAQVNLKQEILIFSSTPAMEFNLFHNKLWQFDYSYHFPWLRKCTQASWQSLYAKERYDELYYLKQIKHHYPLGYSLSAKLEDNYYIYSLASTNGHVKTYERFTNQCDDLYKIGQYCTNQLAELFLYFNCFAKQVKYELSN